MISSEFLQLQVKTFILNLSKLKKENLDHRPGEHKGETSAIS